MRIPISMFRLFRLLAEERPDILAVDSLQEISTDQHELFFFLQGLPPQTKLVQVTGGERKRRSGKLPPGSISVSTGSIPLPRPAPRPGLPRLAPAQRLSRSRTRARSWSAGTGRRAGAGGARTGTCGRSTAPSRLKGREIEQAACLRPGSGTRRRRQKHSGDAAGSPSESLRCGGRCRSERTAAPTFRSGSAASASNGSALSPSRENPVPDRGDRPGHHDRGRCARS